ncbi:L,D-transpeptidase [Crocosphaera sp. XPORK-15E]|nr:L,D-transpeptidase [Crocosphaera sp. XPORK-15E]MEA5535055.1 L,D-transpeptidase [Crocosphaera sp. XPORK-15E]
MTAPAVQQEAVAIPSETNQVLATRLVLNLKERRVYAYQDDKVLASYPVAIGKKGWETPKGNFTVMQMVENPKWKNPWNGRISAPGPNSPLGERWIGFWTNGKNHIGFHGTPGEHVMGQAVSHGCVRMRNRDVKALYELVKTGIPVIVQ